MHDRLALRPDLSACELEERILPAIEFGLFPNPFLLVNNATNQLFVPGTSTSSAGISAGGNLGGGMSLNGLGSNAPGPNWYFLMVGNNASGVTTGSTVGGSLSLYTFTNLRFLPTGALVHTISNLITPSTGGGGGGGGGGDSSSSSSTSSTIAGTFAALAGYGASFSSGYSFALGSGNNYGMFSSTGATTTLGSVPVHNYSGGGDLMDSPEGQNGADQGNGGGTNNPSLPVPGGPAGLTPGYGMSPGYGTMGPGAKLYENLLGKNPGQMGPKAVGPSTSMGGAAGQGNP
jgi:hypothetical protein